MLFRDSGSDVHDSEGTDEFSSGGSLASCDSYTTRAFESRMRLLMDNAPVTEVSSPEGLKAPGTMFVGDGITVAEDSERRGKTTKVNNVAVEGPVSCFNCEGDAEWTSLLRDLDGDGLQDTEFYEYPTPDYFKAYPPQPLGDERGGEGGSGATSSHHYGTKMFVGGLRFEVVQVGRHMISWIFEIACGVRLPLNSILLHRKAKGGRSGSPTGCASVFVASEHDIELLLSMNQRIFCGEKGLYVASSAGHMTELIASKTILDVEDGRVRGPTHPIIIERAYGTSGHHRTRSSTNNTPRHEPIPSGLPPPYDASHLPQPVGASSTQVYSNASSMRSNLSISTGVSAPQNRPPLLTPAKETVYHQYPGDLGVSQLLQHVTMELRQPAAIFVGGLPVDVVREFVAWIFLLFGVSVHPCNVTLHVDSYPADKGGCALVKLEEPDVPKATVWTKRVLCDARGVSFAESQRALLSLLAARDKASGPARPLFIKRKDGGHGAMRGEATTAVDATAAIGQCLLFNGTWDHSRVTAWQPDASQGPPPPYMQNVIIGNQTYQVPVGASIQLQLVPVITAPGNVPQPMPIQPATAPPPIYQRMPPPPR